MLKFVLLVEHLHQICPVNILANIAGECPFPGSVHIGGRHVEGKAEELRLTSCIMSDAKSTCSSVSRLIMYFLVFGPGIKIIIISTQTEIRHNIDRCSEMTERRSGIR
jgi:hypothetical protein